MSSKVTFSILDQSDPSLSKPQHITETFNPDPNWKNFQKPCSSRNSLDESTLGFGYPKFISHEEIKKRNYIRDNSIFLKASIEIPQKIMAWGVNICVDVFFFPHRARLFGESDRFEEPYQNVEVFRKVISWICFLTLFFLSLQQRLWTFSSA